MKIMEVPKDKSRGDLAIPIPRLRLKNGDASAVVLELCKKVLFNCLFSYSL
jgi:hypothetical protein